MAQNNSPFYRDLIALTRNNARQANGIFTFAAPVEDMFVTMNMAPPEGQLTAAAARAFNEERFRIVAKTQNLARKLDRGDFDALIQNARFQRVVHRDQNDNNLDRYNINEFDRAQFGNLVASFTANYLEEGSAQVKLLHFLMTNYNNRAFFQRLEDRYPFKVILAVDNLLAVPRMINSPAEMRAFLLEAFFNLMAQADFYNALNGGGIDYGLNEAVPDDGDINIDEDEFGNLIAPDVDRPALDRFRAASISLLVIQHSRMLRGRSMPPQLRLPENLSHRVICPDNQDQFCMAWCLIIATKIMNDEKAYKAIRKKAQLGSLDNFPILKQSFDAMLPEFAHLYDEEGYIPISSETLAELESIFNININVYYMIGDRACIIHRSTFTNVENNDLARLLFVPYSTMRPLKPKSNVAKFELNSKTAADFAKEIDSEEFFSLNNGHWVLLTPNSSLISGEAARDNYHMCNTCDAIYRGEKVFMEHRKTCRAFQLGKEQLSTKLLPNKVGAQSKFTRYETLSKSPFVLYGDTETQTDGVNGHRLFSFWLYAKHESDPSLDLHLGATAQKESHVGDFMVKQFVRCLTMMRIHLRNNTNLFPKMCPIELEEYLANNEKVCCKFCGEVPISKRTQEPDPNCLVVHHDHNRPSPNIVGYLCQSCNIKEAKINNSFPIVFHNLPYDALVLVKALAVKDFRLKIDEETVACTLAGKSSVLAKTSMKYSSMTMAREKMLCTRDDLTTFYVDIPEIRFIDSCAFVQDSLENIIKDLKKQTAEKDLKTVFSSTWAWLKRDYPSVCEELFKKSTEKGIIAYSHTSVENMKHKGNLPIEMYRSDLDLTEGFLEKARKTDPELARQLEEREANRAEVLASDYAASNEVYALIEQEFEEGDMSYGAYFQYYQVLDVCLLADFFTWFRNTLIPTHSLDPAWYLGLPGYSQNCMLYLTDKVLYYIEENLELSEMITANLRGGLSVVLSKIAEEEPGKHLTGWDINNLYGFCLQMCKIANKYLGEISVEQFEEEEPKYCCDGDFAYFCLVDYDASCPLLQKRVEMLPPLVSTKRVDFSMLSADQAKHRDEKYRSQKLCCTLEGGTDYLVNYDNLLFYEKLGYKFTKIKRVFKFEKEYIFRDYISLNSRLRQASSSEFAKVLYKLLNNIIYGKSLQRNDLNTDIELLSDPNLIYKRLINPRLKTLEIIKDNELVMTNTTPTYARMDTCIQAGFHILELSKLKLYETIYNDILPFCRKNNVGIKFLYSDTDSLYHQLDFSKSSFANYAEYTKAISAETGILDNHCWVNPEVRDTSRKKEVGLFLDEEADQVSIIGYVGLCSKSYCLLMRAEMDIAKTDKSPARTKGEIWTKIAGKGVPTRYLKAMYQYNDYKRCVMGELDENRTKIEFKGIQRSNFANVTKTMAKRALSAFDDKMYHYQIDGVWHSLPHGHHKIKLLEQVEEEIVE